jgi:hypothetical protein
MRSRPFDPWVTKGPLPAPPKTKAQRAKGYAVPVVLDLGGPACPILLQQLFDLFRLSVVRGGSDDALQDRLVIRLPLGSYPERGIAFSYGRVNGKRLDVVMTLATR